MTSIRRHTRSFGQATMEWTPLVRIYESRLWRRSRFFAAATGISFEEEVERIQQAAELEKARDVLDLACGTGIYSRRLARKFGGARVAGLDLSAPMLRYARGRAVAERVENLCLVRGDALRLPFAEASFDAVVCCGALHLFPDVDRALTEVHRVLRPGGRVALAVFQRKRGIVGDLRAEVARRIGVHFFTPFELRTRLEGAGMVTPRELHASGVWLLMSARRPEAPVGGG